MQLYFQHRLESADFSANTAQIRDFVRDRILSVPMQPLLATDGAGSAVRREMSAQGLIQASEIDLEHGYKELSVPAGPQGSYRMANDALHIWPRGNFMLIALPNDDGSFTATLFLPKVGAVSFASLADADRVNDFLSRNFPDARELMPNALAEFSANPIGFLGTVAAQPWHAEDQAMLIGDAAHAMVPFHGQGMNCCFEDCIEFDAYAARHAPWETVFAKFGAARKPNTDAIAAMALENYMEMRESVADPKFQLQQALSFGTRAALSAALHSPLFHGDVPPRNSLPQGAAARRRTGQDPVRPDARRGEGAV